MTDTEIIKALECCRDCNCKECPCYKTIDGEKRCTEIDEEEILNLINRQKAEIERLNDIRAELSKEIEKLQTEADRYKRYYFNHEYDKLIAEAKAEAIKEFAERLHEAIDGFRAKREMPMLPYTSAALDFADRKIDEFAKELIGGE